MDRWTAVTLWGVALLSLLLWLLALFGVLPMSQRTDWLLVISAVCAVAGLLRQLRRRPRV